MVVTLFGIVMEVKLLHSLKAAPPIEVILSGRIMEAKLLQPEYLQLIVFQFVLIKTVEK